jgi:hypothetical protein
MLRTTSIALALSLVASVAYAQDAPEGEVAPAAEPAGPELVVNPDRPSFSAGPGTIAKGHVQFELGVQADAIEGGTLLTFPTLVARAGISEVMELRLGVPSYSAGLGVDDPGVGTTEFGAKIGGSLTEQFDFAVLPFVRFFNYGDATPIGENSLGFLTLMSYGLSDSFSMFSNVGLAVVPGEDGPNVFELAATLGGSLSITDAFGLYVEAFLTQADADPNSAINAGISYMFANWIMIDAYGGAGLSGNVSDVFGGVGVSILR